jgi:tetratricopeptide (TPR) repeat protein
MHFLLKWLNFKKVKFLGLSSVCLLLGLFAKENAITFLFLIPVTVHFFTGHSLRKNLLSWLPLIGVAVLYLLIRVNLLGIPETTEATELMNNPFLYASTSEKFATIFYTLGIYLKLLVLPFDLTHDYYPEQIPIIGWGDFRALVPLILYLVMAAMAVIGLKTKKPTFYGILFYLASFSIVSNLLFPIGSFMNERFMYVPSIGYSIILGIAFTFGIYKHISWNKTNRLVVNSLLVIMLMGYSIKTFSRNKAWESDFTLSTTDVITSSKSAKANMSAGLSLINKAQEEPNGQIKKGQLVQAVKYLQRSLDIYPTYIQPMLLMGNALFELEDYKNSLLYFENCLRLDPKYSFAINNIEHIGDVSVKNKNWGQAVEAYALLISYVPDDFRLYLKLGQVYGRDLGDHGNALKYILKARDLAPDNMEILDKLGIVYSMMGDHENAIASFSKVLDLDPHNASTLLNLGITYINMGNPTVGEEYIQRAVELDPSLKM